MTPDRWKQVKEIVADVLELDPPLRLDAITRACAGDAQLQEEVQRRVAVFEAQDPKDWAPPIHVLQEAGREDLPVLREGDTVAGQYRVTALLGRGGMGEVYEAHDGDATVALKLVRWNRLGDDRSRKRLLREGLLAQLVNHPRVCRVLRIEEHAIPQEGALAVLVMGRLTGETLATRLTRGRCTVEETSLWARQMAEALQAAHDAGVVHRDFKPSNVMLTPDRGAVVMDFGLAKASRGLTSGEASLTSSGVLMGTFHYMSPEQLRGQPATERSDQYALAATVFEMLTGKRHSQAPSDADEIARRLNERAPDVRQWIPEATPWSKPLQRALAQAPLDRFGSIREFLAEVDRRPQRWPWVAVAAAAALLASGSAWWSSSQSARPPGALRVHHLTETGTYSTDAASSRDGQFVVYASDRDSVGRLNLWKQSLEDAPAERLTRSEWNHSSPTVNAAGAVVYRTSEFGGALMRLDPGASRETKVANSARGRNPRFGPRELLAYWVPRDEETGDYGSVFALDFADLRTAPVRLFAEFAHAMRPVWDEQGRHILALGTWQSNDPQKEYDAWIVALDGLQPKGLPVKTGLLPHLRAAGFYRNLTERGLIEVGDWREGWLYFTAPSGEAVDLYRIRLEANTGRVTGSAQRLTQGASEVQAPRRTRDGVVFADTETSYDLYSISEPAERGVAGGLLKHTSEIGINARASLDATGRAMVWEHRRAGAPDQLWHQDLITRVRRRLAANFQGGVSHVLLRPDGQAAAYRVEAPGVEPIELEPLAGGPVKRICGNCGVPADWSPDASRLWYVTGGTPAAIGLLDLTTGQNADSLAHPSQSLFGARQLVNKQGDGWLAFYADNGQRTRQIYVAPLQSYRPGRPETWIPVTDGANWDLSPAWAPDGNTLYFVSRRDGAACLMAQALFPSTKRPRGAPWTVRHFHGPVVVLGGVKRRGAEAVWVAGGRIYLMLGQTASTLRLVSGLER